MFDTFWLVQLLRVSPLFLSVGAVSIIALRDAFWRPGGVELRPAHEAGTARRCAATPSVNEQD